MSGRKLLVRPRMSRIADFTSLIKLNSQLKQKGDGPWAIANGWLLDDYFVEPVKPKEKKKR